MDRFTVPDGLYRSTDNGITWSQISGGSVSSITLDQSERIFWVTTCCVYRSSDGGESRTEILFTANLPRQVGVDLLGNIYVATAEEVLFSTDDGMTWDDLTGGLPSVNTSSVAITSNNNVYVGTWLFDGVSRRLSSVITSIGEPPRPVPTQTMLHENYPNPFNASTTIPYQLSTRAHVTLKVYDVLGREVATLVNEEQSAGRYTVSWDATKVASGVYYYEMRIDGYVETKAMLLLK